MAALARAKAAVAAPAAGREQADRSSRTTTALINEEACASIRATTRPGPELRRGDLVRRASSAPFAHAAVGQASGSPGPSAVF